MCSKNELAALRAAALYDGEGNLLAQMQHGDRLHLPDHYGSDHDRIPYFVIYLDWLVLKVSHPKRNLLFCHKWIDPKEPVSFYRSLVFPE